MNGKSSLRRYLVLTVVAALLAGAPPARADTYPQVDVSKGLNEMPVLTGDIWQTMTPDAKVAFVWGVGHVVTIEQHVELKHPELKRAGFVAKLVEGLRGVPMDSIIKSVDAYYQDNPQDLDLPVMRVIWSQVVRPKLKSGVADLPLNRPDNE